MAVLVNPTTGELGRKVSRTVSADGSVLLYVKWDRYAINDEAGAKATTATVEQLVTGLEFLVNTNDDTGISSYTGGAVPGNIVYLDAAANSVGETIDIINGVEAGQPDAGTAGYSTRWRAGLGDFRPGHILDATSGLTGGLGPDNAMLGGESEGISVIADTAGIIVADTYAVGLGVGRAQSGGGQVYADHFESDYFSDTSGNRFRVRNARRMRESQPGLSEFRVAITEIQADMVATTAKTVSIYDIDDNLLGVFPTPVAAGTVPGISESSPFVGPAGSPLFVECLNTGGTVDGPLTVTGEIRIA